MAVTRSDSARRWLPPLAGWATGLLALVNLGSALTPDFADRARLEGHLVGAALPRAAHALALPVGVLLAVLAVYLGRRRRRAWALAVAVLFVAGALNLAKGLDVEEALACWGLVAVLVWGRRAFAVHAEPVGAPGRARGLGLAAAVWVLAPVLTLLAAAHWASPGLSPARFARESLALVALSPGPEHFGHPFGWVPAGVGLLSLGALLTAVAVFFRPLAAGRGPAGPALRRRAGALLDRHGDDTLCAFKLRSDNGLFFDRAERAFVSYRVEGGVLLVSGDPVGPSDALDGLVAELLAWAELHGLRVGAVGAGEAFTERAARAGLRSFYIGDEAIVDVAGFSLEGRRIRKIRQSVSRLGKVGHTAEVRLLADLSDAETAELEDVSEEWRDGAPERGFSMALDSLHCEGLGDSLVVLARREDGRIDGFLHLAPCFNRPCFSLSAMRRRQDAPNGLTEFLVVRAIEALRERGLAELSLNFAAFGRYFRAPESRFERLLGRVVALGNRFFQIESLYRFNAKFTPRWEPRYLLYQGPAGLPRASLAAMWAEGQLPKPTRA